MAAAFFSESDAARVTEAVRAAEAATAGEIVVCVKRRCWALDVGKAARREFRRLGLARTRDRTGVLLYIAPSRRRAAIWADEGIYAKVGQAELDTCLGGLLDAFREGRYADGAVGAVARIGARLAEHFPRKADDTNELPDGPVTR